MQTFEDFYGDPDPIVQAMAKKLADYRDQLVAGEILPDEYTDLCNDATTLDDVAKAGKTLGELALLDKTITLLQEIAAAIPIP